MNNEIMNNEVTILKEKIQKLQNQIAELSSYIKFAYHYMISDPYASLNKSRNILEDILKKVYLKEMEEPIKGPSIIGFALGTEDFTKKLNPTIYAKMASVRPLMNNASHSGSELSSKESVYVLDTLCDIMFWYLKNYENYPINSDIQKNFKTEFEDIKPTDHPDYISKVLKNEKF